MQQGRSSLVVFFCVLVLVSCASETPPPTDAELIGQVEQGLFDGAPVAGRAGTPLEERMASLEVAAVSIAVIQDFEVIWAKAYGISDRSTGQGADTETVFQAASISKPVTAMAVHRLVESGDLDLDTPINQYLRSWTLPENELTTATPVTLRMLLSHTGGTTVHGFPGYEPDASLPSLQQVLDGESPANTPAIRVDIPPGERVRYSGGGTTIVQQMLIDVLGKSFPELMHEMVLGPFGMSESAFEQPLASSRARNAAKAHVGNEKNGGNSHIYPEMAAAGLWTTPTDLARFAIEIQRAVRGDDDSLINRETAEQMLTPVQGDAALGLFRFQGRDEQYFMHGGGNYGFRCELMFHRDDGYGAAVMTNAARGEVVIEEVINAIAKVYGWAGFLPDEIRSIEISADELGEYAGRYRAGADRVVILTAGDGHLVHRELLSPGILTVYPVAPDTFRYQNRFTGPFTFARGANGRIQKVVSGDADMEWTRLTDDEVLAPELLLAGRTEEAIAAYRGRDDLEEGRLNQMGYGLLTESGRTDEAIAVFLLNTRLFPDSFNTWDSLGEAYMEAGETELAIANYEKSLALNPRNIHAAEMIEQMKAR